MEMHADFKRARNKVTTLVKNAKQAYYMHKFNSNKSSKFLWKQVREIGLGKKTQSDIVDADIDALNRKFTASSQLPRNNTLPLPFNNTEDAFSMANVDMFTVGNAVFSIKSKSVGLDNIHPDFIKILLPYILRPITHIFNLILTSSTYPSQWKQSKIIPIHKKGTASEYRPIAILPFLSKVFESIVSKDIRNYVESKKLLSPLQSGFRPGHSCVTALLKVSDDIRQAFDENKIMIATLLDFSKAFDSVDPFLLSRKLVAHFNFSNCSSRLILSYLTNRVQAVSVNSRLSSFLPINVGVPQGSILGPLLFSLFVNDIASVIKHCHYHIYADDVQLYISSPLGQTTDAIARMNNDLVSVVQWSSQNSLLLNPSKTKAIPFYKSQTTVSEFPHIILGNSQVEMTSKIKNLGIMFNSRLSWDDHINSVVSKIYGSLRGLSVSRAFLPVEVKLKLVKALIVPIITYGCELFADADATSLRKLKLALNSSARYVFNLRRYDHVSSYTSRILGCSLPCFLKYRSCAMLLNIIRKKQPEYLYNKLTFSQSTRVLSIRPIMYTCLSSRIQFFIHAVGIWNHLPMSVRSKVEHKEFLNIVFSYLSSVY